MAFSETIARRGMPSQWDNIILSQVETVEMAALVKAIIATESAWVPTAVNPSDPSYGLMQILLDRGPGYPRGPYPGKTAAELLDPITNIVLGTAFLRSLVSQYGATSAAISAYNAGRPTFLSDVGGYRNQAYVDSVQTYWTWYLNTWPATVDEHGVPIYTLDGSPTTPTTSELDPMLWVGGGILLLVLLAESRA